MQSKKTLIIAAVVFIIAFFFNYGDYYYNNMESGMGPDKSSMEAATKAGGYAICVTLVYLVVRSFWTSKKDQ